ncbi:hypothetical protein THAOC_04078 [Thalassiosira oceanica]|uniref:Uncharacterized protein n=1 Tax=Thalassiosira oceanica TaxID=159749 RepID=K0T9S9_THAOC|nr:hypothetical protein THAOC_04078 [Thalassiosira oceanica]|eukprot:EJK74255.1 hypothetical protein THAOC_04078 [Thalassiosira oceanica]
MEFRASRVFVGFWAVPWASDNGFTPSLKSGEVALERVARRARDEVGRAAVCGARHARAHVTRSGLSVVRGQCGQARPVSGGRAGGRKSAARDRAAAPPQK